MINILYSQGWVGPVQVVSGNSLGDIPVLPPNAMPIVAIRLDIAIILEDIIDVRRVCLSDVVEGKTSKKGK